MNARRVFSALCLAFMLLFLLVFGLAIRQKEDLLKNGASVALELAPLDPRSLMQGDYMKLDFAINRNLRKALEAQPPEVPESLGKRLMVLAPQSAADSIVRLACPDNVYVFAGLYDGSRSLQPGELLLAYRDNATGGGGFNFNVAGSSFFFQEGQERAYSAARYALLKVSSDGTAIITDLLDGNCRVIPPRAQEQSDNP